MHMSPPCICTGVLKIDKLKINMTFNSYILSFSRLKGYMDGVLSTYFYFVQYMQQRSKSDWVDDMQYVVGNRRGSLMRSVGGT